ncbi:tetratricopeptide repeat protein [Pseudobdellovibrio sp. HCB154]|uniref:tetratricopeptide repeat protein n=1 Tax=Pseudobdellovibrio sp. HCB154 TaxID=3386277 RepID=UPI003916DD07
MKALKISGVVSLFFITACASSPYPYFDSSMNDHNRAPASLGVPQTASEADQSAVEQQAQADYLFLKADLESADGEQASSIENLKSAIQIDPQSVVLMQKLSVEYYKKGQVTDAIYWIQKALEKDPKRKDNLLLFGSMLMAKKEFDKAEVAYNKIVKQYPKDAEAYLYLGALHSEKNEFAKANTFFSKVITIGTYEPKHLPYYYRARSILDSGNKALFGAAKKDLTKVFEQKPDFLEAIQVYSSIVEKTEGKKAVFKFYVDYQKKYGPVVRLAEVLSQYYIEKDQYDKAYEQLEFMEANSEDPIQVKLKMALILIDKKNYGKAMTKLEELNEAVPESDKVKFYLSAVYEELKQPEKAIKTYLSIQPSSNHYDDARVRAAFLLKNTKQLDKALSTMKEAVANKKENLQLHFMLAQIQEDDNQFTDAISTLKRADDQFPKNTQVHYFLGTLYDRLEKKDLMMKHMRQAVNYDEKNHQALNYVAYSISEMGGDLDEAEQFALKAYALQKDDAFIIDTLGWVYFKKGEYAKALTYLEKAHEFAPDVGVIAEHLGDVYLKLKKDDKARNAYLKARKEEKDSARLKALDGKITSLEKADSQRSPASSDTFYP